MRQVGPLRTIAVCPEEAFGYFIVKLKMSIPAAKNDAFFAAANTEPVVGRHFLSRTGTQIGIRAFH
jgi:hypothetical protein